MERHQNDRLDIISVEMILEYDITFSVAFSAIPDYFVTSGQRHSCTFGIHPIAFNTIFLPVEIFDKSANGIILTCPSSEIYWHA